MVNLKDFYREISLSEETLRGKINTVIKYLQSGNESFTNKTILVIYHLIFKEKVSF